MNGNAVGEKTLGYLRGERDLFEERKQLAEVKKKADSSNLPYWMTGANKRRMERFWQVVALLQENSRMTLMEMSRKLKIPLSTLFDTLKEVEKSFHFTIVLKENERHALYKDTIPVEFPQEVLIATKEKKTTTIYWKQERFGANIFRVRIHPSLWQKVFRTARLLPKKQEEVFRKHKK